MKKILVMSAHPDDETLGCGGTLLKHRAEGDEIAWMIATKAHEPVWTADVIKEKRVETEAVAKAYGMKDVHRLDFLSGKLGEANLSELMEKIRSVISEIKPHTVYLVHGGDVHTDHRFLFKAALGVLKPFYMKKHRVSRILSYETISSTEAAARSSAVFNPDVFSDMSSYLEEKIKILSLYKTEMQSGFMPRTPSAVRALARYRGATIGVEYAEAFMVIREIF